MFSKIFVLVCLHGLFFWYFGDGQACNSLGFICTTCDSLQFCTAGVPSDIVVTCPTGTFCDSTSSSYCTTTECTEDPLAFYDCTSAGRFAVGTNCSQYVFCSNSTTLGIFVPELFVCPTTTVFNPATSLCVLPTDYTCPDGTNTATTTEDSICTTAGRYPVTTDSTCQSYTLCVLENNGTYTATSLTCPTTTVFNENSQTCVLPSAYNCPY